MSNKSLWFKNKSTTHFNRKKLDANGQIFLGTRHLWYKEMADWIKLCFMTCR